MAGQTSLELSRDCEAVQLSVGNKVVLPAGTVVELTQVAAGAFTVRALGALFEIQGRDADALGLELPDEDWEQDEADGAARREVDEKAVWRVLRFCRDPEIPINIVDLGLVYGVAVEPRVGGGRQVTVKMTLTARGCPMAAMITEDARKRLLALPGAAEVNVDIVWDPPWNPSMISPAGRRRLGLPAD
jgi:probable FeS assembly SUF system protein SufT